MITKIHSPIYGAHLGRKKTCNKVTERMYRPGLKNEVIDMRRDDKQIGINCKINYHLPTTHPYP